MDEIMTKTIKDLHPVSFKGIFLILKSRHTFCRWYYVIAYILCFLLTFILFFNKEKSYDFLMQLIELILIVFPCLCGFSISGLAIVIAFGNQDLMKKAVSQEDFSIYQKGIAIFACNIILQLLAIFIGVIIKFISTSGLSKIIGGDNICFGWIVNSIVFFSLSMISLITLLMTFFVVSNLFTFGQLNNFYNTLLENKNKEDGNPN